MESVDELEEAVSAIWGAHPHNWTIGRSGDGWFYFCGEIRTSATQATWKHSGTEPTLGAALRKMIELEHEPSNRLTEETRRLLEQMEEGL